MKVSSEEGGALLHLTIDAGKGNIVTGAVMSALTEQLAVANRDPKVRCVLLDAAGSDFSFGASVEEHRPAQAKAMIGTFSKLIRAMIELPLPLLVAVKGRCLGGAMEVALAGSRIFAGPTAKLGQPEIKLAVFAPPASVFLPMRVGQAKAEDLLLSGRTVGADEALSMGLVDEVCPAEVDPSTRAREYAAQFLAGSASSLRFATRAARAGHVKWVVPLLAEVERLYLSELMATPDAAEGIEAFIEKRAPKYGGG
ncbi:MAG: enoyl-CoA hydratase/isomerase family protein [Myxococcaceae bacterium]